MADVNYLTIFHQQAFTHIVTLFSRRKPGVSQYVITMRHVFQSPVYYLLTLRKALIINLVLKGKTIRVYGDTVDTPNYSRYTFDELIEARESVDHTLYPERAAQLDRLLNTFSHDEQQRSDETDPQDKYKTFGPRVGAIIVDSLITAVGLGILSLLTGFRESSWFWWIDSAILIAYAVILHGLYGQTLGKMATGVKVLDEKTESAITFTQAALRDCVPIMSTLVLIIVALLLQSGIITNVSGWLEMGLMIFTWTLLAWHLLEVISMLTNQKRRAIHDYIAGTVVIKE